jgi:hypothetical protein
VQIEVSGSVESTGSMQRKPVYNEPFAQPFEDPGQSRALGLGEP